MAVTLKVFGLMLLVVVGLGLQTNQNGAGEGNQGQQQDHGLNNHNENIGQTGAVEGRVEGGEGVEVHPGPNVVEPQTIAPDVVVETANNNGQSGNIEVNPQPILPQQPHNAPQPSDLNWQTLTDEQKKKMLEQQSILSAMHLNKSADLHDMVNMTVDQRADYHKMMELQATKAYENAMREMQIKEKARNEQLDRMAKDQTLTMTQEISHKQNEEFKARQDKFNPRQYKMGAGSFYRHQFNEYMFQVATDQLMDFGISLPVAQDVALFVYTYSNREGVYSLATDLGDDAPAQAIVIENNYLQLKRESFFFKKYLIFQGKQHFSYTIRLRNLGPSRLFALSVVHLLQHSHIGSTIDLSDVMSHEGRARGLYDQLQSQFSGSQSRKMMQISNNNKLSTGISVYYTYTIIQILIVIGLSCVQLKLIQKLLNPGSVV